MIDQGRIPGLLEIPCWMMVSFNEIRNMGGETFLIFGRGWG